MFCELDAEGGDRLHVAEQPFDNIVVWGRIQQMRKKALAIVLALVALAITPAVAVADCNDLWYERNQIFDDYGFCFKTKRGRDTFDNSDCNTSNPKLSAADRRKVKRIEAKERRQGCSGGQSNRQRPPRNKPCMDDSDCSGGYYCSINDYGTRMETRRCKKLP